MSYPCHYQNPGRSLDEIKEDLKPLLAKERNIEALDEEEEQQKRNLIREIFTPSDLRPSIHFRTTNSLGYPVKSIITRKDLRNPAGLPIITNKNTVRKNWLNEKKPTNFVGEIWPPMRPEDLLTTWNEWCILCERHGPCSCEYEVWRQDWERDWMLRFQIKEVGAVGYGLFTTVPFDEHDKLGEATGQLEPVLISKKNHQTAYCITIPIGHGFPPDSRDAKEEPVCWINARWKGNVFRFLNHSCEPNAMFLLARCGDRRMMCVVATRRIEVGEQVTIDYGSGWYVGDEKCLCQSWKCRNPIEGSTVDIAVRAVSTKSPMEQITEIVRATPVVGFGIPPAPLNFQNTKEAAQGQSLHPVPSIPSIPSNPNIAPILPPLHPTPIEPASWSAPAAPAFENLPANSSFWIPSWWNPWKDAVPGGSPKVSVEESFSEPLVPDTPPTLVTATFPDQPTTLRLESIGFLFGERMGERVEERRVEVRDKVYEEEWLEIGIKIEKWVQLM
ncbi:SET domain-containing protein [Delitschia confertaspora ATCC 74209]|uniref:SET domain-containing protein n=1 Tax=Delitschia confertaspora ATCC 74209 TaxID=1513339 RepID=A0A9P4JV20_9PLEO|nr:SET domain-containing protein [Delitschia confertaspora ATCC 74209]